MPGAAFNLPADYSENHYYPARETDSAPVQVCADAGKSIEQEKFLFYRGVGTFDLPVAVKFENDRVALRNLGKDESPSLSCLRIVAGRSGSGKWLHRRDHH